MMSHIYPNNRTYAGILHSLSRFMKNVIVNAAMLTLISTGQLRILVFSSKTFIFSFRGGGDCRSIVLLITKYILKEVFGGSFLLVPCAN